MPKTGVTGPWIARYTAINGVISYSDGIEAAKSTNFNSTISQGEGSRFYANNKLQDEVKGFSSGTLTNSVDGLSLEANRLILGINTRTISINGKTVVEEVYDEDTSSPYLGYGIIFTERNSGVERYKAVVLKKIIFDIPNDVAETQADTITWQVTELSATIMRDDSPKEEWQVRAGFDSMEDAKEYIRYHLNIMSIGTLTVTSEPGDDVGDTHITVTPQLQGGHSYRYIIAAEVGMPEYGETIAAGYTAWDGNADITAATGLKILVVEVDGTNRATKAGIATIKSNDGE